MWEIIKQILGIKNEPQEVGPGALIEIFDPLKESEKITLHEIVGGAPATVEWTEKGDKIRKFPDYNQFYTMMCGAFSAKKMLGILYYLKYKKWIEFAEEDCYQRRKNKPGVGMYMTDIFKIMAEGMTLKELTGAIIKYDSDADNCVIEPFKRDIGKVFAIKNPEPIWINPKNIDEIASVIQVTGKGVLLNVFFTDEEWSREFPKVVDLGLYYGAKRSKLHFIVATDYTLIKGKKYIVIEDSAYFGGFPKRYLSEEFLVARVQYGAYPMTFKFIEAESKETFTGTIISLQKCLQSVGDFPANIGFYEAMGPATREALKKFQARYGLPQVTTWPLEPKTLVKVKELFG